MLALQAAVPLALWGPPDMRMIYAFFAGIAILFIFLFFVRGLGRMKERKIERNSAWQTFRQVARARGLSSDQTRVLALVAREAKIKRPAQVMGSINVFDQSVEKAQTKETLNEGHLIVLEAVRRKLLTTAVLRDPQKELRQFERAMCSLPVNLVPISRDDVEQEVVNSGGEDDEKIKERIDKLAGEVAVVNAQIINIGAGGTAIRIEDSLEALEGDFVKLGGEATELPFDINGFYGEIRNTRREADQGGKILHLRFLPYDQELRREVIKVVYQQQETENKKPKKPRIPPGVAKGRKAAAGRPRPKPEVQPPSLEEKSPPAR